MLPINYSTDSKKLRRDGELNFKRRDNTNLMQSGNPSHPGSPQSHPGSPRDSDGTDLVSGNDTMARLHEIDTPKMIVQNQGQACEKCQVCGGVAGKHHAYGGKVCHSCRAFFRRSVQTKYYEIFACTENENCNINSRLNFCKPNLSK
jgi:hypothetical protein